MKRCSECGHTKKPHTEHTKHDGFQTEGKTSFSEKDIRNRSPYLLLIQGKGAYALNLLRETKLAVNTGRKDVRLEWRH